MSISPDRRHDPLAGIQLFPLDAPPAGTASNELELADILPTVLTPAAVLIGIVERAEGAQILLTRRTDHLRAHAGQISFPGGRIEADDASPVAAALRESFEEVAIDARWLQPLGFLDPYATITGFRVLPLVARLDPGYQARPDPGEVADVFELPLAHVLEPANCELREADYRGRIRHYCQFRYGEHLIWGATAAMLVNLRQRLIGR